MRDLCQRFGLWLAQQAGWSDAVLVAPHQAQIAGLNQQVESLLSEKDTQNQSLLNLQSERAKFREQITEHMKNVAALTQQLQSKEAEIKTLQGLFSATGIPVSDSVLARAVELTEGAETSLIGGEAKRHAVYARLIKEFPDVSKRVLAFGIEYALSGKGR